MLSASSSHWLLSFSVLVKSMEHRRNLTDVYVKLHFNVKKSILHTHTHTQTGEMKKMYIEKKNRNDNYNFVKLNYLFK